MSWGDKFTPSDRVLKVIFYFENKIDRRKLKTT